MHVLASKFSKSIALSFIPECIAIVHSGTASFTKGEYNFLCYEPHPPGSLLLMASRTLGELLSPLDLERQ